MTRLIASILSLTLGFAMAFALVSCGSDDEGLLPGDTAEEIERNLDEVQDLADAGDCEGAQDAAAEISQQVADLGSEVKPRLRRALAEGAARVEEVVATCEPTVEVDTETVEPDTETFETETSDTEPTETTDTTETTETTETSDTTETTETTAPPEVTETTTTAPPTAPPPSDDDGSGGIGPGRQVGDD